MSRWRAIEVNKLNEGEHVRFTKRHTGAIIINNLSYLYVNIPHHDQLKIAMGKLHVKSIRH